MSKSVIKTQYHIRTPLIYSVPLSKHINKHVYLKLDAFQRSGSFKDRGIGNLMKNCVQNGVTNFIGASGGNAGLATATIANLMNIPCKIIVPKTASLVAINLMKQQNADVLVHGNDFFETNTFANELVNNTPNSFYIHPYDHELIWEGHSSLIDELNDDFNWIKLYDNSEYYLDNNINAPECIICSVGGGGLFNGICQGIKRNNWDNYTTVITSETIGCDAFYLSKMENKLVTLDKISSIANTLGARTPQKNTLEYSNIIKECIPSRVTDADAVNACKMFLNDHRILVEPACGASLAIVYNKSEILSKFNNIVIQVCGGSGVDINGLITFMNKFNMNE